MGIDRSKFYNDLVARLFSPIIYFIYYCSKLFQIFFIHHFLKKIPFLHIIVQQLILIFLSYH